MLKSIRSSQHSESKSWLNVNLQDLRSVKLLCLNKPSTSKNYETQFNVKNFVVINFESKMFNAAFSGRPIFPNSTIL